MADSTVTAASRSDQAASRTEPGQEPAAELNAFEALVTAVTAPNPDADKNPQPAASDTGEAATEDQEAAGEETPAAPASPQDPPEEADPDDQAAAGAEDEEASEDDGEELSERAKAIIQKRIGKEVGKRKNLETELATVKARLAEVEQKGGAAESGPVGAFDPKEPWGGDPKLSELRQQAQVVGDAIETMTEWVEALADPDTDAAPIVERLAKAGMKPEDTSPKALRAFLRGQIRLAEGQRMDAATQLSTLRLERGKEYRAAVEQTRAKVRAVLPGVYQAETEEGRWLSGIKARVPELWRIPYADLLVADSIAGRRARLKAEAAASSVPKPKRLAPAPGSGVRNGRKPAETEAVAARRSEFAKNPTLDNLAGLLS